jgi:hypothetical protein
MLGSNRKGTPCSGQEVTASPAKNNGGNSVVMHLE